MKAWPEFDAKGDLPPGIHAGSLAEVGGFLVAAALFARLLERIYALAKASGHLARFIVFGSFVTAKAAPNDVDIFLLMSDSFGSR